VQFFIIPLTDIWLSVVSKSLLSLGKSPEMWYVLGMVDRNGEARIQASIVE
jgi:hypothetical protein